MACVVALSLMRTLELEFLQPHRRPILQQNEVIPCNKELVQSLHKKLGCLMELFDENRMDDVEAIKHLETKLRNVASQIEDEIELQVVHLYGENEEEEEEAEEEDDEGEGEEEEEDEAEFRTSNLYVEMPLPHKLRQILHPATGKSHNCLQFHRILHRAKEEIDAIEEELVKAKMEYDHFIALQGRKTTLDATPKFDEVVKMDSSSNSNHASHSQDIMVGKNNEIETIKKMLIEHPSKQREVVSIKGMGGIGKTTLARRVYEDPSIASHFDKRAWAVASQHHSKRRMLLDFLDSNDNADNSSDEDLASQLYQGLKRLRYLVVIDDVWSVEAWNAIKVCFPDDINGSRVLLTTRLANVANQISSNNDFSHQMHFLDQSESWNLFYEKACKSKGAEFEKIGIPVVEKCKGLPLAIIVVAGLFSKLNTLDEWKKTGNALSSSSAKTLDDDECSRIFSLSYNHLPHNLKACFLYLGVFPEDEVIDAIELARLWFAEGFVKASENESLDAVANRYIQELMDRNLIILSKLSCCGRKIERFRVHDLLHAFCVNEAQNQNLLHVVMSENSSGFPQKGFRWVSIQSVNVNMSAIGSHSKRCRSFFSFRLTKSCFLNFTNFNLLSVFYDRGTRCRLGRVKNIVHLRFLWAMGSNNVQLSSAGLLLKSRCRKKIQLSGAWNLQTLGCTSASYRSHDGDKYTEFPQLQFIYTEDFHGSPPKFVRELSWLSPANCSKEYIMNIPYLKEVGIGGERRDCNDCITNLAYLEQLEGLRLCCRYCNDVTTQIPINNHIVLLKNLRELTIFNMGYGWKEINVLSKLPRLEELRLLRTPSRDEEWEIPEEVIFGKLIYLHIYDSDLKHWKASHHSFPKLERLDLFDCRKLRNIPIGFEDILTLKKITLRGSFRSSVMKSAMQIQEAQRDCGNEDFVVDDHYAKELPNEFPEHESDGQESD